MLGALAQFHSQPPIIWDLQACAISRNVWRSLAERAVFAQPKCSSAYSRNSFAVMRASRA